MGQFLAMSCVAGCKDASEVLAALQAYASHNHGQMERANLELANDDCLIISTSPGGVTVAYPRSFLDWDNASQCLSERLKKPVFSFHIHDGDLWMYVFFDQGEVVDQFNPVPNYWGELDDDEAASWQGNPTEIARRIPGLAPENIANYLVRWNEVVEREGAPSSEQLERLAAEQAARCEAIVKQFPHLSPQEIAEKCVVRLDRSLLGKRGRKKAYPSDQYFYGDDWQLMDFVAKLGFAFPVDGPGAI